MFGTAKIFGSIKNKSLMIRTSAGVVMDVTDFFANFASKEEEKCRKKNAQELNALHNGRLTQADVYNSGLLSKDQASPRGSVKRPTARQSSAGRNGF